MTFILTIIILSILKLTFTIGRFIAAKRLNLPVSKFVVGIEWGKPLYQHTIDEVSLIIYPIFFGGYLEYKDDYDPDVKCSVKEKGFLTVSSLFTMFLAVLLIGLVYINFVPSGKYETVITKVSENSSLQQGDKVLRANGFDVNGKKTFNKILLNNRKFDGIVYEDLIDYYRKEIQRLNPDVVKDGEIVVGSEVVLPERISEGKFSKNSEMQSQYLKLDEYQKELRDKVAQNDTIKIESVTTLRDLASALADFEYGLVLDIDRNGTKMTVTDISPDEFGNIGAEYSVKTVYTPRAEVLKAIKDNCKIKFEKKAFVKNLISIFTMLFLISILVLVHEIGHFLAAKMFKIKVERFGFGLPFGPILWQKQCGETLLVVHAFLLGGYVSFPDDAKGNSLPKDSPDRFTNKPVYQRFIVVSAGVFANIVCAVVIVAFTALLWGKLPTEDYNVFVKNIVNKENSSLINSGLQVGDRIAFVNGSEMNTNYAFQIYAIKSKAASSKVSPIVVQKNIEAIKGLNPKFRLNEIIPQGEKINLPDMVWEQEVRLTDDMLRGYEQIKEDKFAISQAQSELRDMLAGKKSYVSDGNITLNDIAYALSDVPSPLDITVERNGEMIELTPVYSDDKGIVGIEFDKQRVYVETKTLKAAFVESCRYLYNQTNMLLKGLWQLFSGKVPLDNMHGVVAVVKYGGDVIQQDGFFQGLLLTALISLDLAIVNFLPIPALDGGHAMFLLIEKIYGKPLDEEVVNSIATAGFLFLILLMVIVVYNDVVALVMHKI